MTYDEMIKVIEAKKKGRTIQREASKGVWRDVHVKVKSFDFQRNKYRVKPERKFVRWTQDDHEDFTARKFVFAEQSEIIFHTSSWNYNGILFYPDDLDYVDTADYSCPFKTYSDMATRRDYDGNPCGKVVEE